MTFSALETTTSARVTPDDFADIYRTHRRTVLAYLDHRTHNYWLVEDITSETFVRAWKSIDRFEPRDGGVAAWLVRIARNLLYDHARAGYGHYERLSPYDTEDGWDPAFELPDPDPDPAELVVRLEANASTARALADLRLAILRLPTDDQREAMLYRHVDGLSVQETADQMGSAPAAIKSLCLRATRRIARQMVAGGDPALFDPPAGDGDVYYTDVLADVPPTGEAP